MIHFLTLINSNKKPEIKTILLPVCIMTLILFMNLQVLSQVEILSVNPPSAFQGETIHLIIQANGTNFTPGITQVAFPDCGIVVNDIIVNGPELLSVNISIPKDAAGICKFFVTTGDQQLDDEFEITGLSGEVETMINIFPVENMAISDYDISNPRNLPLLFTILVYTAGNDFLIVKASLIHEKYGLLVTADKDLVNPGFIAEFDNRMFDGYDISKSSDEILESTGGGGIVPPGIYTYVIDVFNENNVLLASVEADFYIDDASSGIDLLTPGTSLDLDPEIISTPQPDFQWTGSFSQFSFALYEVLDDQASPDEISSNIPVFTSDGIQASSLLYPVYAQTLEKGKKYAWQVSSSMITGSGNTTVKSELYWFNYLTEDVSLNRAVKMEISPDDIDINPGDSVQMEVAVFDVKGNRMKVDYEYSVIPSDGGTVNDKGIFVAGKKPGVVAVKVNYKGLEDYITITIKN